jgi:hypothetical protein
MPDANGTPAEVYTLGVSAADALALYAQSAAGQNGQAATAQKLTFLIESQ